MKIALFIPCYIDQIFPEIGVATVEILKKFKLNVYFPEDQTCCGQPAFNTGYRKEAKELAYRFVKIFEKYDYIVSPSGSCTAMVKNFYSELGVDERGVIKNKIFELTQFLVNVLNIKSTGASFEAKVTYHDSCHLLRELGIKSEPRLLLKNVKGLELVEMPGSENCCGFGGTFSVKFPEISTAMVEDKVKSIQSTGAQFVTSTDASCLMQIDGFIKRNKIPVKTIHIAEILANF